MARSAFILVWLLSVAAWVSAGLYLAKASRLAKPGTSFLARTNPFSLLTRPDIWLPESRRYWRIHYISLGVFLVLCVLGILLADALPRD